MILTELEIKKVKPETKAYKLTDGGGCWRTLAAGVAVRRQQWPGSLGLLGSLIEEDRLPERRAKRARRRPRRQ